MIDAMISSPLVHWFTDAQPQNVEKRVEALPRVGTRGATDNKSLFLTNKILMGKCHICINLKQLETKY